MLFQLRMSLGKFKRHKGTHHPTPLHQTPEPALAQAEGKALLSQPAPVGNSRQQALLWPGALTPGASRCPRAGGPDSSDGLASVFRTSLLHHGRTPSSYLRPRCEADRSWGTQSTDSWDRSYAPGWRAALLQSPAGHSGSGFLLRIAWAGSHWAAGGPAGGKWPCVPPGVPGAFSFLPGWASSGSSSGYLPRPWLAPGPPPGRQSPL